MNTWYLECDKCICSLKFMAVTGVAGWSASPHFHSKKVVVTAACAQLNGLPDPKVNSNGQSDQMHYQWAEGGASGSRGKRTSAEMDGHTNFCRRGVTQIPDQYEQIRLG